MIENAIDRARTLLCFMGEAEAIRVLTDDGVAPHIAFLAVKAAAVDARLWQPA